MSQYPAITAGQRITAALLQSMIPVVIVKQSSTSRTSTTTPADDPDLTFSLVANATYLVEFSIRYGGTPNLMTVWNVPVGVSGNRTALGPGSAATDTSADNISMHSGVHGYATTITYGHRGTGSSQLIAFESSVVTTVNAGTVALQWAQGTSNATATSVGSGSFMRVTRLA